MSRAPGMVVAGPVLLGIGLRAWHYVRCPDIWYDEAALVVNVLEKSFRELLGPLPFNAPPPPLFAWIERAVYLTLGDSLYALRLVPFLASCGSLVLLAVLARRVLSAAAAPWAVLLFAVSDRLLWHACEAKQYAVEVFAAVLLLWMFDALRTRPLGMRIALFTPLAPAVIFVCYPGVFLCGGILVGLLPEVWRSRRATTWAGYALLAGVVCASFAVLMLGPVHLQRSDQLVSEWYDLGKFPPWSHPLEVPWWFVRSTLEIFDYAARPSGFVLAPLAVIGGWTLWRRGRADLLAVMLVPMGLPLLASLAQKYPYGGVRLLAYLAPALVLLLAEGTARAWAWLAPRRSWLARAAAAALVVALLVPAVRTAWRAVFPWTRANAGAATAYVCQHLEPGEVVASWQCTYRYLFRHASVPCQIQDDCRTTPANRMWWVLTVLDDAERTQVRAKIPPDQWEILEEHDFPKVAAFRLRHR